MSIEIIPNLSLKNSLLSHATLYSLKEDIINKLKTTIPQINKLKLNIEITEIVVNLCENLCDKKASIQDKRNLVINILNDIFSLNVDETNVINQQLDYIYDNDLIIKIPKFKKYLSYFKDWFRRKFL